MKASAQRSDAASDRSIPPWNNRPIPALSTAVAHLGLNVPLEAGPRCAAGGWRWPCTVPGDAFVVAGGIYHAGVTVGRRR